MARLAYTYIHPLMIAGIIVAAVGDEMVLAHPEAEPSLTTTVMLLAAPALYLLGNLLFKRTTAGHIPFSHMAGLGLLAVLAVATPRMPPLPLSATATLTLVVVAAWETLALRRGRPAPRDP
jgi:low temperature requirement protein LtrA